jgi:type II secretory pathway component GspD/PulD (secretin)
MSTSRHYNLLPLLVALMLLGVGTGCSRMGDAGTSVFPDESVALTTPTVPVETPATTPPLAAPVAAPVPNIQVQPEYPISMMQIAVEAMVVEVNENYMREIGLDYTYNRIEQNADGTPSEGATNSVAGADVGFLPTFDPVWVPTFTDVGTAGGYTIGEMARQPGIGSTLSGIDIGDTGEIVAQIRGLLDQGKAEIRTRPIVVALNGTPAEISTVDEVPFQDVNYVPNTPTALLSVSYENVGIKLTVTPTIMEPLEKQMVRLDIPNIEVSGVSHYSTIRNVSRPVIFKANTNGKYFLHNGETLVISGLKSRREITRESRIPILGRIPIVSWLFKSQRKEFRDRDILFFITPYILPPGTNPLLPFDFEHQEVLSAPTSYPTIEAR